MSDLREWLAERCVDVAVVSFAPPEQLRAYQRRWNWPFPIYADPGRALYAAIGLERLGWLSLISPRTIRRYLRLMIAGHTPSHASGEDVRQAGGDVLVNDQGAVVWMHRGRCPADRPTSSQIRAAVESTAR